MSATQNLTKEQIRVLKLISTNNLDFQNISKSSPEKIDRWVKQYYQDKPVIDDLNNQGVHITKLYDLMYPDFSEEQYIKAIPILVKWLNNNELQNHVKASIIQALIEKPVSKNYAFDAIINIFKSTDKNYRDEWGFQTDMPMMLGNAFRLWVDDDHAEIIFNLLKNKKFREDDFLLGSLANFKKPENIKKATAFLMKELQKPNIYNARLGAIISTLKKLKAVEARELIYPFTNFPNNYKRTIEIDPKKYGYITDTEIRNEAKKTIAKFDKLINSK
ncbi:hypothetical protein KJ980_07200 [Patescibacteria group bacterium]|nr:hypothetical protein [Patescibacteria group bacterium]MBU4016970.1 hypothetical protein [Patescibacteria group bacterium]MBU4099407.1 hypothetical protein [Patescibacteria group bacterium]